MKTEEEIISAVVDGDTDMFEYLVERYQGRVYGLACRMMSNHEDAKDVAQEVFIKAFRSLGRFRRESSFSTWIYRITVNTCNDELKKKKRKKTVSMDAGTDSEGKIFRSQNPASVKGPAEIFENKELGAVLAGILEEINPDHKTVILLRDIYGCSYDEIAGITGCSAGTVKSRISRARNEVRKRVTAMRERGASV